MISVMVIGVIEVKQISPKVLLIVSFCNVDVLTKDKIFTQKNIQPLYQTYGPNEPLVKMKVTIDLHFKVILHPYCTVKTYFVLPHTVQVKEKKNMAVTIIHRVRNPNVKVATDV